MHIAPITATVPAAAITVTSPVPREIAKSTLSSESTIAMTPAPNPTRSETFIFNTPWPGSVVLS